MHIWDKPLDQHVVAAFIDFGCSMPSRQKEHGTRTMIRPSMRMSMLSYSQITTFVLYKKTSAMLAERLSRYGLSRAHLLQVLEDHVLREQVRSVRARDGER